MIQKKIHYCWFGGKKKTIDVLSCIDSWRKFLPDYEIFEWNEKNFDIEKSNQYVKEAYANKKWAFVSDYVRLVVLHEHGGLYFDTDVEVFKSFDVLLNNECFFGFESNDYVASAVIGCEAGNKFIKRFMESYNNRKFVKEDGLFDMTTNVDNLTKILKKNGLVTNGKLQKLQGNITIFPQYYFASNDVINIFGKYNKRIYAYHHYMSSWYMQNVSRNSKRDQIRHYIVGKLRNIVGTDTLGKIRNSYKRKA